MTVKSREEMLKNHSFTSVENCGFDDYEIYYNDDQIGGFNPDDGYINLFGLNSDFMPDKLTQQHLDQLNEILKLGPVK